MALPAKSGFTVAAEHCCPGQEVTGTVGRGSVWMWTTGAGGLRAGGGGKGESAKEYGAAVGRAVSVSH